MVCIFCVGFIENYCNDHHNSTRITCVGTCTLCLVGVLRSLLCGFGRSAQVCIVPIPGRYKRYIGTSFRRGKCDKETKSLCQPMQIPEGLRATSPPLASRHQKGKRAMLKRPTKITPMPCPRTPPPHCLHPQARQWSNPQTCCSSACSEQRAKAAAEVEVGASEDEP